MDRNTITGFLLIFAMVIVYQLYFVPAPEVLPEGQTQAAATPETPSPVANFPTASANALLDSTYVPQVATLRSDVLEVEVSTDGGIPVRATLKDGYLDYRRQQPIQLGRRAAQHELHRPRRRVPTSGLTWSVDNEVVLANRGDGPFEA